MNYKEKMLAQLKGFLDMEALDARICIEFMGARLFYDLLIKDIKEEKKMDEKSKTAEEIMEEEKKMKEQLTGSPFVPARLLTEDDLPKAAKRMICLYDTSELMTSANYKERFVAEYFQTKIRYEKLKAYNTKIEAARRTREPDYMGYPAERKAVEEPRHDCPCDMLRTQQGVMGEYLHILEVRAVIEGINLDAYK